MLTYYDNFEFKNEVLSDHLNNMNNRNFRKVSCRLISSAYVFFYRYIYEVRGCLYGGGLALFVEIPRLIYNIK